MEHARHNPGEGGGSTGCGGAHVKNCQPAGKILSKKETLIEKEMLRKQAKDRLKHNLESLASYCRAGARPEQDVGRRNWGAQVLQVFVHRGSACWPSRELLCEIEDDVLVLAKLERVKPILPVWKAFEQMDKRTPKLRLKMRMDNLIGRALDMLAGESELGKAVREAMAGTAQAQCRLRDMILDPDKLAELLRDDRRIVIQRCRAQPLVEWLIEIMHPQSKDFNNIVELLPTVKELKAMHTRERTRERLRRHRLGKKNPSEKRYTA